MNVQTPRHLRIPPLQNGDRLTRAEFERRYHAMPHLKKAELVAGEVFMGSPVTWDDHGEPHSDVVTWGGTYKAYTPGVGSGDNATVRLDEDNEPQPDLTLLVRPQFGGRTRRDEDGYVSGAPELVFEVAASSASIDLGRKLQMYLQNEVTEYVVWQVYDERVDWFVYRNGTYDRLPPDSADGLLKSERFPGLWLDAAALARGDLPAVLAALQRGIASPDHAAFVQTLAAARR